MWKVQIVEAGKGAIIGDKDYPSRAKAAEAVRTMKSTCVVRNQETQTYRVLVTPEK